MWIYLVKIDSRLLMLKLKVFYCHIFPVKERNVYIYYSFSEVFIRLFNILDCIFEFQTN